MSSANTKPAVNNSVWQRFIRHRRLVQFAEYMVGGGVYFVSGFIIFAILYSGLGWDWLWAKIIADAIGWTLNYLIQRYWAFNDNLLRKRELQVGERYLVITLANFAIDYAIVASMKTLGVTPYLGMITSSLFFTAWNYLWYRFWVFNTKR